MGSKGRGPAQKSLVEAGVAKAGKPAIAQAGSSRQEGAEYIASMLESLKLLARQAHLPFLAYLLGIALEEANSEKVKRD